MKGLKGQALVSALFAAVTRGMGFVLRLWMSSLLGAQVMGMAEMAGGVQQLLCTPLIGGLPLALSRLTAMEAEHEKGCAFYVARRMALRRGAAMAVLCVAGAPFFARALGDMRLTLVLMCFAPALPVISVCCALDGYAFGTGRALFPALSEWMEQGVRMLVFWMLAAHLPALRLPLKAAAPVWCGLVGELAGLLVMLLALRGCARKCPHEEIVRKKLDNMSLPLLGSRMGMSLFRSANALLLPRLLMMKGFTAAQSASQLGLLQGMVMPLLFLPGIFTGALASLGGPRMAALRGQKVRRLARKLSFFALLAGAMGSVLLSAGASVIGERMYHQPALAPLIRFMAPGCMIFALTHIFSAMLTGLGRQKALLARQMAAGCASLVMTLVLTLTGGLYGAGLSVLLGQALQAALLGKLLRDSLHSAI